jgi:hypothetical protein
MTEFMYYNHSAQNNDKHKHRLYKASQNYSP